MSTRCEICNIETQDGVNLSNSGLVHTSCLESLQSRTVRHTKKRQELENKLVLLQNKSKRHQSFTFKIVSIFSKPEEEAGDIEKSMIEARNEVLKASDELSLMQKHLTAIYDILMDYPPDWDDRRQEVSARDGRRCQSCRKESGRLHMHHKIPLGKGGTNMVSNLELLCEACHSKKHGNRTFSQESTTSESAFSKRVSNIRDAIDNGKRVEFLYIKPGEKRYKKRTIRPIDFETFNHRKGEGSTLCIMGYCELRSANRCFALKRMKRLKIV